MRACPNGRSYLLRYGRSALLVFVAISCIFASRTMGQTAVTGALTGVTLDASGAVIQGVALHLINKDTDETQSATSDEEGRFHLVLLAPDRYQLEATRPGFAPRAGRTLTSRLRKRCDSNFTCRSLLLSGV